MVECPGTDCTNDQTDDEANDCVDDNQHDGLQKTYAETLNNSDSEGKSDHCRDSLKESSNGTKDRKNTSKNKCGGRHANFLNFHGYTVVTVLILRIYTHGFSGFQLFYQAGKQSKRTGFA